MGAVHTEEEFNTEFIQNRSEWLTEFQFTREVMGPCLQNNLAGMILVKNCVRPSWNLERNAQRLNLNST
jgi:hypothetical protein